jgi:uncharacterized transporter YbjL
VSLGPAGSLLVRLFVGALDPRLGQNDSNVQSLGLGLFVYTVGIASGAAFFRSGRRQPPLTIRRRDVDLLAHDDLMVELGDRIRVCVPRSQLEAINQ